MEGIEEVEVTTETPAPAAPETVQTHRDSVADDVRASIASLKGEGEPPIAEATVETKKDDRPRAPDGKFLPADAAKSPAAPVAAAPTQELPSADDQTKASVAPSTASAPPAGWTADAKAQWASLPPAVQAAALKREEDIAAGGRQWSEEKRRYEATLAPLAQEASQRGMDLSTGIQKLIDGNRFLETQPEQAILWLAQRHNIDLSNLASNPPAPQQAQQVDPRLAQLSQTVTELQDRLRRDDESRNLSLVEKFFADNPLAKENDEALARHVAEVKAANPHLPPSDILQQAFDRVVWLNPDIRAKRLEQETAAKQAEAAKHVQAKAAQASKAAVSVKGSSAALRPPAKNDGGDTVYDAVRASIQQLRAN